MTFLKRFIYESGHYLVAPGLALIGLGVYLEVGSTSPDKQALAAGAFSWGAMWIGVAVWLMAKPRLKSWWKARQR